LFLFFPRIPTRTHNPAHGIRNYRIVRMMMYFRLLILQDVTGKQLLLKIYEAG